MKKYEWRRDGKDYRLDGSRYWLKRKRGQSYAIMLDNDESGYGPCDLAGAKNIIEALEGLSDEE